MQNAFVSWRGGRIRFWVGDALFRNSLGPPAYLRLLRAKPTGRSFPIATKNLANFAAMKRFVLPLFLLVLLAAACDRNNVNPETAMNYNNALVSHGDTVLHAFDAFNTSVDARNDAQAQKRLELAIAAAQRAVEAIAKMPSFDGDSSLRDATLGVVRFYARSFTNGFKPMLPVLLADTLSEQQAISVDSLIHDFSFEEDSLRMVMVEAQAKFSGKYGLQLH